MRTPEDIERDLQTIIRMMVWWMLRKYNPFAALSWSVDSWYSRWMTQWHRKARETYPVSYVNTERDLSTWVRWQNETDNEREQHVLLEAIARTINVDRRRLLYSVMPWWAVWLDWGYGNVWSGVLQGRFVKLAWYYWTMRGKV